MLARSGPGGVPFHVKEIPVKQAWHRQDSNLTYYIKGTKPGEELFNPLSGRTVNSELTNSKNYEDAANAWNNIRGGVAIAEIADPADAITADVVIIGYWDPYYEDTSSIEPPFYSVIQEDDGVCGSSVACTTDSQDYVPGSTYSPVYPLMGYQTFHIEERPRWGKGNAKEWTTNFSLANRRQNKFEYLPWVLMHEFGHTFGLGHSSGSTRDIMNGAVWELPPCSGTNPHQCGLSDNEKNAVKSIYQP